MAVDNKRVEEQQPVEPAVFVTADGRRARRLRRAAVGATVLAVLWIVGLGVGMLGFGSLPGVSIVKGLAGSGDSSDTPKAGEKAGTGSVDAESAAEARRIASRQARADALRRSQARAQAKRTAARPAALRPAPRPPAQAVVAPPPAARAAVNPAQRTRGWARNGASAPRGQQRKAGVLPPPPPPGTRGQRRGQTTTTTTPPPVPPGQQKKTPPPPPPPPPPGG